MNLKKFSAIIIFLLMTVPVCKAQEEDEKKVKGFGVSVLGAYSFTGVAAIADIEYQKGHHIFYTGPKLPISQTYLAFKSPFGWNLGYRHELPRYNKRTNFFFNFDYQVISSKVYSPLDDNKKRNYVHEFFLGYGIQYSFSKRFYIGNIIGVGAFLESFYSPDLEIRQSYYGYDSMLKFFVNYRFR